MLFANAGIESQLLASNLVSCDALIVVLPELTLLCSSERQRVLHKEFFKRQSVKVFQMSGLGIRSSLVSPRIVLISFPFSVSISSIQNAETNLISQRSSSESESGMRPLPSSLMVCHTAPTSLRQYFSAMFSTFHTRISCRSFICA